MKKICLILIVVSLLLSLVSCTQYIALKRYEELPTVANGIHASNIDYETMLRYYEYFYKSEEGCVEMYLPREGEFVTEDGRHLEARIDCYNLSVSNRGVYINFYLFIYREDGTLCLGEELTCSYNPEDEDLDGVNNITDAMRKYWDASKALPSEIFAD